MSITVAMSVHHDSNPVVVSDPGWVGFLVVGVVFVWSGERGGPCARLLLGVIVFLRRHRWRYGVVVRWGCQAEVQQLLFSPLLAGMLLEGPAL